MSGPTAGLPLLAEILAGCEAGWRSGIVKAERGKLRRLFCVEQGWIVHATSNLLEEQFPEVLVQAGLLAPADRAAAVEEAARRGCRFSEIVVERKTVEPAALRAAMERHVESLLRSCLDWPDGGSADLTAGRPSLTGEVTVRLSAGRLLARYARTSSTSADALRVRIGPPDVRPVRVERPELAGRLELDDLAEFLLGRADGTLPLGELIKGSPGSDEAALRAIYGFLLAGVLRPSDRPATGPGNRRPEAALSREEVQARMSVPSEADHYAVLGVERSSAPERIRDAYYAIARRYHPDRFRSGSLRDLLPKAEHFFTRVTEAYNTLSDRERRAEYDQQQEGRAPEAEGPRATDTAYLARQNFLRARALLEKKRAAEAVGFLENAVRLDPTQAEYHLELGMVLARSARRKEEAERHLISAAQIEPARVAPYLALGRLYERAGRREDAARMFREALRWDPSNAEAPAELAGLGPVAQERGDGGLFRTIFKG